MNTFLTWPPVSFLRRNLWLSCFLALAIFLALSEWAMSRFGGIVYFPSLILAVALSVRLWRIFMSGKTTAAYCDNLRTEIDNGLTTYKVKVSNIVTDFHSLEATHRVWITFIEKWVIAICAAILLAHLWK